MHLIKNLALRARTLRTITTKSLSVSAIKERSGVTTAVFPAPLMSCFTLLLPSFKCLTKSTTMKYCFGLKIMFHVNSKSISRVKIPGTFHVLASGHEVSFRHEKFAKLFEICSALTRSVFISDDELAVSAFFKSFWTLMAMRIHLLICPTRLERIIVATRILKVVHIRVFDVRVISSCHHATLWRVWMQTEIEVPSRLPDQQVFEVQNTNDPQTTPCFPCDSRGSIPILRVQLWIRIGLAPPKASAAMNFSNSSLDSLITLFVRRT